MSERSAVRWPPWGREKRQSGDYTGDVIQKALEIAQAGNPSAAEHAAAQYAASLLGRALATAAVEADPAIAAALDPATLDLIGRSLVLAGESFFDIRLRRGRIRLAPAVYNDCRGGPDPEDWLYTLRLGGPDGERYITRRPPAIVHCRYATSAIRPWRGQGPLTAAAVSTGLAASLEAKLAAEIGKMKVAHVLPVPFSGTELTDFRKDVAGANGGLVTAPAMTSGWGTGAANAPRGRDYQQARIGPVPPDSMVNLRDPCAGAILSACGLSPGLLSDDGPASREAYRQALHSVFEPIAALVSAELAAKLERPITIRPLSIGAIDIQSRARAYRALTQGDNGIAQAQALALCGFDPG